MTTITRERLEWLSKISSRDEIDDIGGDEIRELARIALASLTAEPAAWTDADELRDANNSGSGYLFSIGGDANKFADPRRQLVLYTAPPSPIVPDIDRRAIADKVYGKCMRIPGATFYNAAEFALDEAESCRAAMLQDSQPVSNRDELPVIGWLRSDYNSDDKRDPNAPLFMLGRNDPSETWGVKYIPLTGNSPVIPDCWCHTCRPVTMGDMRFVVCPECGNKRCPHANDHRNACTGSNEPGQEGSAYPSAPQQEAE